MDVTQMTTYQAAVIQARAHRVLKTKISYFLRDHGLTMMQWSIIGFVHQAGPQGIRISDIAHELDTSLAFITTSINVLEAKGFVKRDSHAHDNRAKLVRLTDDFQPKVAEIEKDLRKKASGWIRTAVTNDDIVTYLRVLTQIAKAGDK
ncbi:MAG: MarR family winged helix-turn-helix transcriptional regulator [Candidatus Saccharimonadales bacterium]